jgi:hypothetical protein
MIFQKNDFIECKKVFSICWSLALFCLVFKKRKMNMKNLKLMTLIAFLVFGTPILAMQTELDKLGMRITLNNKWNREEVDKIKARAETESLDDLKNDIKSLRDHDNDKAAEQMQAIYDRRTANLFIVSFNNAASDNRNKYTFTIQQADQAGHLSPTSLGAGITKVRLADNAEYVFSGRPATYRNQSFVFIPSRITASRNTTEYTFIERKQPMINRIEILVKSGEEIKAEEQQREKEKQASEEKRRKEDLEKSANSNAFTVSFDNKIDKTFASLAIQQVDELGKLSHTPLNPGITKVMLVDGAKYRFSGQTPSGWVPVIFSPDIITAYKAPTVYTLSYTQSPFAFGVSVRWELSDAEKTAREDEANKQKKQQEDTETAAEQKLEQDLQDLNAAGVPAFMATFDNQTGRLLELEIRQQNKPAPILVRKLGITKVILIDGARYNFSGRVHSADKIALVPYIPKSITASKTNTNYRLTWPVTPNVPQIDVDSDNPSPQELAQKEAETAAKNASYQNRGGPPTAF